MGRVKGLFNGLQERVGRVFYNCGYIKECDKVTPQCREGGNSYCGEYLKRSKR